MFQKLSKISAALAAFSCIAFSELPAGYTIVHDKNFETNLRAGDYFGKSVWYFYSNSSSSYNVTVNDHPELHKRFIITNDPVDSSNKVLHMIKFSGDKDYQNPYLNPRTELSGQPSMSGSTSDEIYFHLRTYFPLNQRDIFAAEFTQFWLHGSTDIPLQIEVRNGYFAARDARSNAGSIRLSNNARLNDYLGKWITWEVRAKFNNTGGYWYIYMNGEHVFTRTYSMSTWPSNGQKWHPQFGIYANNGGYGQMEAYFDDLIIARKTGIITPVNKLPTINIIAPINNKQFTAPALVQLTASASDPDGSISKVAFFNGTTLLGTCTTSPYTWTWANVPAGNYVIAAKATDNNGAVSPNTSVSFSVINPVKDCSAAIKVRSNGDDGNVATNTIDKNLQTRWSSNRQDAQIVFSLPCPVILNEIGIAFYKGNERKTMFDILISSDSLRWNTIYQGQSNGTSLAIEPFKVSPVSNVRYIKLNGHGNTLSEWTSITEVNFKYALNCTICTGGTVGIPEGNERLFKNESSIRFSSGTTKNLVFSLNKPSKVTIKMFSLNGTLVGPVFNKVLSDGSHRFSLNDLNLPHGTYLCRLQIDSNNSKIFRVALD
jgi:hypothetical protein